MAFKIGEVAASRLSCPVDRTHELQTYMPLYISNADGLVKSLILLGVNLYVSTREIEQ